MDYVIRCPDCQHINEQPGFMSCDECGRDLEDVLPTHKDELADEEPSNGPSIPNWAAGRVHLKGPGSDMPLDCQACGEMIDVVVDGSVAYLFCGCTPDRRLVINEDADAEGLQEALRERREGDP